MKVSIIIPVYNSERYLGECLDSVLNQTLKDIQIICVNDASTDHSEAILEEYARKDSRIVLLNNKQNGGLSYTRNHGMKVAEGEYIYFLDSDDSIVPEAMEELYAKAKKLDTDVLFFDSEMTIEGDASKQDHRLFCSKKNYGEERVYNGIELADKMQKCNDYRVPVWLQFWKHAFLKDADMQFYNRLIYEDELFTYQSMMMAERVACIPKTYHKYRRHTDTITLGKVRADNIKSMLIIIEEITAYWNAHQTPDVNRISRKIICGLEWQINEFLKKMSETVEQLQQEWGEDSIYSHYLGIIYRPVIKQEQEAAKPEASQKLYIQDRIFTEENLIRLAQAEKRYVYGAGKFARKYINYLRQIGVGFNGVIVTDRENNPDELEGIAVYGLDELKRQQDTYVILIGVGAKLIDEVKQTLVDNGIDQYIIAGE